MIPLTEHQQDAEQAQRVRPAYTLASPEFFHLLQRIDQTEQKLEQKIAQTEQKLEQRISQVEQALGQRIDQLDQKIGQVDHRLGQKIDGLGKWIMATLLAVVLSVFAGRIL